MRGEVEGKSSLIAEREREIKNLQSELHRQKNEYQRVSEQMEKLRAEYLQERKAKEMSQLRVYELEKQNRQMVEVS